VEKKTALRGGAVISEGRVIGRMEVFTMSWKDDLEKDLRTPADDAADTARARREAEAEARRTVSEAEPTALAVLREAEMFLATKPPSGSVSRSYGGENSLSIYNHKLAVAATPDNSALIVALDGVESRLVFNRQKYALVLETDPQNPVNVEDFVGQKIRALVKAARR